jgi:hypothetical protein
VLSRDPASDGADVLGMGRTSTPAPTRGNVSPAVHFFSVSEIKSIKLRSHIQRLGAVNCRVAICYTRGARFTL